MVLSVESALHALMTVVQMQLLSGPLGNREVARSSRYVPLGTRFSLSEADHGARPRRFVRGYISSAGVRPRLLVRGLHLNNNFPTGV